MKKLFTALLILVSITLHAQTGSIRGIIYDETGRPLPDINLSLENTAYRSASSSDGTYRFTGLAPGNYTLSTSGVGYKIQKQGIEVQAGSEVRLNLKLDVSNQTLTEVVIMGRAPDVTSSASITRDATPIRDLPQHIQVINQSTMEEQQLFTLDKALKNVAGVTISAGYGAVNMRGFTSNPGSFLTNGIKGSPYPEGVIPLLGNVERIDVIHGASAILYGEGSVGGNINLVTKQPKKQKSFNATLGGGSFGLFRGIADVTGSLTKNRSLYFLAGVAYQSGGRFTRNFYNRNLQAYGSLKWELGERTSVQVNGNYLRDRSTSTWLPETPAVEGIGLLTLPENFTFYGTDNLYKGNSYQLQATLQHQFNTDWSANVLLGLSESRADRREYSLSWAYDSLTTELGRRFNTQQLNSPTRTINPYVTGKFNLLGSEHKLTAGLDITYSRSKYPSGFRFFDAEPFLLNQPDYSPAVLPTPKPWSSSSEKFTYNTFGAYAQDLISLSEKFKALLGLRYTNYFMRYKSFDDAGAVVYDERPDVTESLTPRAGLVYQPAKTASFYADYNRGFIPQYSNERRFGGPFEPETSHQFEVGYKGDYLNNRLHTTLALYRITKKNVLKYYEDESLPDGYGFKPLQQVVSQGVELGLSGSISSELSVIANYSYNKTEISRSDDPTEEGTGFYNAPGTVANGWLSYSFRKTALKGLIAGFGVSYVGKRTAYFGEAPGYTTVDAMAGYRFKNFTLQLNANNLLNERYILSTSYADYTPGTPRNLLVTLSYLIK